MFGARDIFGIKPFTITRPGRLGLVFGSEIKAFLEHPKFVKAVNENALRPYLTLQYSATEETFFKGACTSCPRPTILCMRTARWTCAASGTANSTRSRRTLKPARTSWTKWCTNPWPPTALRT